MNSLSYIIWSANPEIFPNIDWLEVRWYGLFFALAFIIGQQILYFIYKKENKREKDVDAFTLYILVATVIGARLGHVLFYEPAKYLSDPLSILMIWKGGLASHGAAIGIIIGVYLYCNYHISLNPVNFKWHRKKREGQDFFWVIDRLVILVALGGCFIRMGNFTNSEIIGKPTESNNGVLFASDMIYALEKSMGIQQVDIYQSENSQVDSLGHVPAEVYIEFSGNIKEEVIKRYLESNFTTMLHEKSYASNHFYQELNTPLNYEIDTQNEVAPWARIKLKAIPRHPAQLYESFTSFIIFLVLFLIWYKKQAQLPRGLLFGIFLIVLFGLRFVHELFKENQVNFEDEMTFNMGQILSIPLIITGIVILLNLKKLQPKEKQNHS